MSSAPAPPQGLGVAWRLAVCAGVALVTIPLLVLTTVPGFAFLILAEVAATAAVGWGLHRLRSAAPWAGAVLAVVSLAVAVGSILSGRLNGLSDEPYSTPAYAQLGWHLYTQPIQFTYLQYGTPHFEVSYDVYLPLLTFVQLPGVDYRWVSLGAWAATWALLRRDSFAAAGWASPWIALLAANGQNDFVPLFALTATVVLRHRRAGLAVEAFAMTLKQFVNVIAVVYHLLRREFARAAFAALVTLAVLAPFLWIDPGSVYCHVVLGDPTAGCAPHSAGFVLFKRNYWLYPTWIGLVFSVPISAFVRRWLPARSIPGS